MNEREYGQAMARLMAKNMGWPVFDDRGRPHDAATGAPLAAPAPAPDELPEWSEASAEAFFPIARRALADAPEPASDDIATLLDLARKAESRLFIRKTNEALAEFLDRSAAYIAARAAADAHDKRLRALATERAELLAELAELENSV